MLLCLPQNARCAPSCPPCTDAWMHLCIHAHPIIRASLKKAPPTRLVQAHTPEPLSPPLPPPVAAALGHEIRRPPAPGRLPSRPSRLPAGPPPAATSERRQQRGRWVPIAPAAVLAAVFLVAVPVLERVREGRSEVGGGRPQAGR